MLVAMAVQVFKDAHKSPLSVIILVDIERWEHWIDDIKEWKILFPIDKVC